jgi:hypothetical protein
MTHRTRHFRHAGNATRPSLGLPLEPGLWGGPRYPLDVRPKISFRLDGGWVDAPPYKARPSPGLMSRAFYCLKSGTKVLCGAIGRLVRRVSTRHDAEAEMLVRLSDRTDH